MRSAPVSQAVMHGKSSQSRHGEIAGSMIGVSAAARIRSEAFVMAPGSHASMQSPHRVHASRNSDSASAPGGLSSGNARSEFGRARERDEEDDASRVSSSHEMTEGSGLWGVSGSSSLAWAARPRHASSAFARSSGRSRPRRKLRRVTSLGSTVMESAGRTGQHRSLIEAGRRRVTLGTALTFRMARSQPGRTSGAMTSHTFFAHPGGMRKGGRRAFIGSRSVGGGRRGNEVGWGLRRV